MKKNLIKAILFTSTVVFTACDDEKTTLIDFKNYSLDGSINFEGDGVAEISAYDKNTKTVFATNAEDKTVEVIDIKDTKNLIKGTAIDVTTWGGNVNSVDVKNGMLAIAVEGNDKVGDKGSIVLFKTNNLNTPYAVIEAGYLPDMVKFSPDGKYVLSANEGEPNDDYTIDPEGSITIVEVATKEAKTIGFESFKDQQTTLESKGFRIFGKDASFTQDIEPEYIAISNDSKYAFVALQENNGIAKVNIENKMIEAILPLGVKDFSLEGNAFDVSDKDGISLIQNWPVKSFYMPDAIDYFEINGVGYIISANEGDARDYGGFSEEERVEDLILDPNVFPNADELQDKEVLGRLKVTTVHGDANNDGKYEEIYGYGGRSFSIWDTNGNQVYDSGNMLMNLSMAFGTYPEGRSDDKGTEPEAVVTYTLDDVVYAAVGLERSGDVFIFNISNPTAPFFVQHISNTSPEGIIFVAAKDSPNNKPLLIVSNEHPEDAKLNIFSK